MANKQEIVCYYNEMCQLLNKQLTRSEYRKLNPIYTSSLIEKVWGSWKEFVNDAQQTLSLGRCESVKRFDKKVNKIVITYIHDGSAIDMGAFNTLRQYCKQNKAELGILWGKVIKRDEVLDVETYNLLSDYLATRFEFDRDPHCIAQDYLIPFTQKNPLLRLETISTSLHTIVAGSVKQYLKIFPYKQYDKYRVGISTGTISKINYQTTSSGFVDVKYHTLGGVLLDWDETEQRYVVRNLVYKNGELYDEDKCYSESGSSKISSVPALVLGDLHFPEESELSIAKTHKHIRMFNPKVVAAGDWCSYNSINHHTANQAFTKLKNRSEKDATLAIELKNAISSLNSLTKPYPNTEFKIVYSNHDKFVISFLNDGLFVKDVNNAEIGCELFLKLLRGQPLFKDQINENVTFLTEYDEFEVDGIDLSNHGHVGVAGSRGNPKTYTKLCEKAITGHTHSPALEGNVVVVGTNSRLKLNYTSNISNWAFANAVVYPNGTIQLLLK